MSRSQLPSDIIDMNGATRDLVGFEVWRYEGFDFA